MVSCMYISIVTVYRVNHNNTFRIGNGISFQHNFASSLFHLVLSLCTYMKAMPLSGHVCLAQLSLCHVKH